MSLFNAAEGVKFLLVLILWIGAALGAPSDRENNEVATILKYDNTNDGYGSYSFEFETSDGVRRREEGALRNAGGDPQDSSILAVIGVYEYPAPDGGRYEVRYTADDRGYRPTVLLHPPGGGAPVTVYEPPPNTDEEPKPQTVPRELQFDVRFNDRKLT